MNLRRKAVSILLAASVVGVCGIGSARADLATIRREAKHGNAQAQLHLGILYEFGRHLADHDVKAVVWYTLAAERGSKEAAHRLDLLKAHLTAAEKHEVAREVASLDAHMPAVPAPKPHHSTSNPGSTKPDASAAGSSR